MDRGIDGWMDGLMDGLIDVCPCAGRCVVSFVRYCWSLDLTAVANLHSVAYWPLDFAFITLWSVLTTDRQLVDVNDMYLGHVMPHTGRGLLFFIFL